MEHTPERPQIRLEFKFSVSPNYERAVSIAQRMSSYASQGEGRKLKHLVTFVVEEAEKFLQLLNFVREWKSTVVWLNEKEIGRWEILHLLSCVLNRRKDYEPDTYCGLNNYWGCRLVRNSLTTGKFDKNGIFHFDKARFLFEAKEKLELLTACPFFDKELILQRLEELDEMIDPRTTENWDYLMELDKAIGVRFIPLSEEVEFAPLEERGEKAWRTRIITIPDEQWEVYASQGHIPEVDVLLEQEWRLVTVIARNEMWYCILERPY